MKFAVIGDVKDATGWQRFYVYVHAYSASEASKKVYDNYRNKNLETRNIEVKIDL